MIVVAALVSGRRGGGLFDSLSFGISIDFLWYATTAPPPFFFSFFFHKEQPLDLPSPNSQPFLFMDAKEQPGLNYLFLIYYSLPNNHFERF